VLDRYVRGENLKDFKNAGPFSCRVIGIAEDAKFASLREPPPRTIYFPLSTETQSSGLVFLINSSTKAEAVVGYRKALSEIAPSVPIVIFASLKDQMDAALGSQELITMLSNIFAALALFLSALGLYGLLSSSVVQRTGEIGVRIALGAQRGRVLRMILSEAMGLLGVGVLLGGIALVFAIRFIQNMLFGVSAFDPITIGVTLAVLILVTLFAAAFPALRAASVDPIEALRAEWPAVMPLQRLSSPGCCTSRAEAPFTACHESNRSKLTITLLQCAAKPSKYASVTCLVPAISAVSKIKSSLIEISSGQN
jgi:hypothetical protein